MKKIILCCSLVLFFSCNQGSKSSETSTIGISEVKDSSNIIPLEIRDSLDINKELGDVYERSYTGLLPAASCPGIEYTLDLYAQKGSGDGVYKLNQRYLEAENGKDIDYTTYGRQYTLRGDAKNIDAIVYQLIPFNSADSSFWLVVKDGLKLLNNQLEEPETKLNYTITLK